MPSTRSYKNQVENIEATLTFDEMGLLETLLQAEVENIITGEQNSTDIQKLEDMAAKLGIRLDTTCESVQPDEMA